MNIAFIDKFPSKSSDNSQWIYTDNLQAFNKFTQFKDTIEMKSKIVTSENKKNSKLTPFQFVNQLHFVEDDYLKNKLLDFISIKEFQSVFGVKNTTEIMNAITNNKWNKQLVILFSFLFDTSFIYLKKNVCFDTNQKYLKSHTI